MNDLRWRFCCAPMMDWTDRHCRYFLRLISRRARLYTEMITSGALLHGDVPHHLDFDPAEHPVALQLGGSDPALLATCARAGRALGLRRDQSQLRLPVRARADRQLRRVPDGRAGARRRLREGDARRGGDSGHRQAPDRARPRRRLRLRPRFRRHVAAAGCDVFIVHARNAVLKGLSPKENREVPPLRYDVVAPAEARFSGADDRHQRRARRLGRDRARARRTSTA